MVLKARETDIILSAISSLGGTEGPRISDFQSLKAYEADNDVLHLGRIIDQTWYVPKATPRQSVIDAVEHMQWPAYDTSAMRVALYQLWLTTKHEKLDRIDREAMLTTYVDRLKSYPADMVSLILADLSATSRFFPAWADMQDMLDESFIPRRDLTRALRIILNKLEK